MKRSDNDVYYLYAGMKVFDYNDRLDFKNMHHTNDFKNLFVKY